MALTPNTLQKSSRWGSFLAGVESRLDTILADEDTAKVQKKNEAVAQEQPGKLDVMAVPKPGIPQRTSSATRAQDRLNEKLAKAMANKNLGKKGETSVTTSGVPSRTASPANTQESARTSLDNSQETKGAEYIAGEDEKLLRRQPTTNGKISEDDVNGDAFEAKPTVPEATGQSPIITVEDLKDSAKAPRLSTDSRGSISTRPSLELTRPTTPNATESPELNGIAREQDVRLPEEYQKNIAQMNSDYEAAELRRQEETHTYLEQIDALQSKLQYLTREAAEIAKNASAEARPGSMEHKIAAKDEKIALLIEEGQKLSQTELKHMSIIKRLRAKVGEDEKSVADYQRIAERHEKAAREARERANRAESAEKRASDKLKNLVRIDKELEIVKADRDSKVASIQDLQAQLSQATSAAKEAEVRANTEALESERRRATDLADELSSVKTEKELAEKRHHNQLRELSEKAEREKERARVAEIERQGEQSILESRLEAYRARVEEASAGQTGDVQAKLLRQIETLQNQYAVASENWQGIEGSLLARITVIEKERDDIAKREADVRRKARELNTKSRRMEEEIERLNAKTQETDYELSSRNTQLAILQDRLNKSGADLAAARNDLKVEREVWESRLAQRAEEDKAHVQEEMTRSTPETMYQQFRTDSPIAYNRTRKLSFTDRNNLNGRDGRRSQGLGINGSSELIIERPVSRRSSTQPLYVLQTPSGHPPTRPTSRHDSQGTVPQVSVNNGTPETPSITGRDDDFFSGIETPATPERTFNDLISVSTAAAGPSVQLVERMSAAVRRLESDKAAHKDELIRLTNQRDESREQTVALMKEVEEKRGFGKRVGALEKELKEMQQRYLTTLEMLGEKSETVEELKADVQDVKQMYRDLVDSTMKG